MYVLPYSIFNKYIVYNCLLKFLYLYQTCISWNLRDSLHPCLHWWGRRVPWTRGLGPPGRHVQSRYSRRGTSCVGWGPTTVGPCPEIPPGNKGILQVSKLHARKGVGGGRKGTEGERERGRGSEGERGGEGEKWGGIEGHKKNMKIQSLQRTRNEVWKG